MLNKRIIIGAVLIVTLALQMGCSVKDPGKNLNNDATKQETTENTTNNQEDKQKNIMNEFDTLIKKDTKLVGIVEFINGNIPLLSEQNASMMIIRLEEVQKKNLSKLEEMFYDETVQSKINKIYGPSFDINKIENVDDQELKNLLEETRDSGYKVETAEGMYFPIINYEFYNKYSANVTADIEDYIDIMAVESHKVPAKDAALVIGWDEVLKRALHQEEFINQYPDSLKINDIKDLYKKYVSFTLYGTNNTPLFSYDSKEIVDDAKNIYIKTVDTNEKSKLVETLRGFLEVLEKSNYRLTHEVEKYRKSASENM